MNENTYITKVNEVDGQLAVDFPHELYEKLNWELGDILVWSPLPSGDGFVVTKLKDVK